MKILLVDDSLLDRKLMVRILMKSGITQEIIQAQDGEEATEILAQQYQDICVVLLDWQMPKMSGIELLAGMVKIPQLSNLPVFMVTASGSDENKRMAYSVNPNLAGYLVKPYKPEDLLGAIKPYLK